MIETPFCEEQGGKRTSQLCGSRLDIVNSVTKTAKMLWR
jgi:hypothetical protein